MAWGHTGSPTRLRKPVKLCHEKLMVTVFWDAQGILLIEFMTRNNNQSEVYCRTLKKLRAIQNKRRGPNEFWAEVRRSRGASHCQEQWRGLLKFKWAVFQHPPRA
ncbi:hypothetical protein AVEN_149734-1 [Araneus ventricosus]|uniref:Mariner Mos1 transposase n=1 Tax=Araneus ventricosus TaxID=182803 RepID=A0A4Y2MFA1_ARAVE|nr:hypothetical protein AVEN_149734-1 [Araneus ventricosus]